MNSSSTGRGGVTVVGSIHVDLVYDVPTLPRPGETVLTTGHRTGVGGKGANQAVAAAAHGVAVSMVGAVGTDADADVVVDALRGRSVDTQAVVRRDGRTGCAIVAVDPAGENLILVDGGASASLGIGDVHAAADAIAAAAVVVVQGEVPAATSAAAAGLATGTVILTPAPVEAVTPDLIACADILVPNLHEAERLVGADVVDRDGFVVEHAMWVARALPAAIEVVLLTLGSHGVLVRRGAELTHVPAGVVTAVDTTGAGDAFVGAVAAGLARGDDLMDAVHAGQRYAAKAVQVAGATPPADVDGV